MDTLLRHLTMTADTIPTPMVAPIHTHTTAALAGTADGAGVTAMDTVAIMGVAAVTAMAGAAMDTEVAAMASEVAVGVSGAGR